MDNIILIVLFCNLFSSTISRIIDEDLQNASELFGDSSDLEVIYLPSNFAEPLEEPQIPYNFTAFGR